MKIHRSDKKRWIFIYWYLTFGIGKRNNIALLFLFVLPKFKKTQNFFEFFCKKSAFFELIYIEGKFLTYIRGKNSRAKQKERFGYQNDAFFSNRGKFQRGASP